jgi:chlorite dismutase
VNEWPYHQYWFYELDRRYRQLPEATRSKLGQSVKKWAKDQGEVEVVPYATVGFKPGTDFTFWVRAHKPEDIQNALRDLLRTPMGEYLTLSASLFGIIRQSTYSNRPQKQDQVIQANERLPYLIIYPFTKTPEWHLLDFDTRRTMMKDHIMIGISHPSIRQCLLYSYGVDDHEFVVSYETPTLDAFQQLVIELRSTEGRRYTQNDLPVYTCIYKPLPDLLAWL